MTSRTTPNQVHIPLYEGFDLYLISPIKLIYLPGHTPSPEFKTFFDTVLSSKMGRQKQFREKGVTDDNPFFMFSGLLSTRVVDLPMKIRNNIELFKRFWVATILFALVCIMLPVMVFRRRIPSYRSLVWLFPYFFLIGGCFMMLEIGIINWFCIFVGSPGASIAVVLTSILIASGVGSYTSEYYKGNPQIKIAIATAVLAIGFFAIKFVSPYIFDACWRAGITQVSRGIIAGLMILPIGFAMGWFFPSGVRLISQYDTDNHLIPWAVSINGFASVLGSIVALPISITLGFSYLFIIALSGYIVAGALSLFSFRGNPA